MHTVYDLLTGPMAWLSFIIFFGGIIYQLIARGILAKQKDGVVFTYWSFYYAIRSILHWICPFASTNSRKQPILSVITFVFHLFLLIGPIFLFAHVTLINEAFHVNWWYLPDSVADIFTLTVIGGCIFFFIRRLTRQEVRYLTEPSDYIILLMVAAPFITGFWAHHQWIGFRYVTLLHIFSGEILLAAIPFTKLNHMVFFPFTRGYMGSEFGGVRMARDW